VKGLICLECWAAMSEVGIGVKSCEVQNKKQCRQKGMRKGEASTHRATFDSFAKLGEVG
jgi:hypothetical protein